MCKFKNDIYKHEKKHANEFLNQNIEINKMINDLLLTLQSLNYKKKEINTILPIIIKELEIPTKKENNISFEYLLKLAMNYLEKDSSNNV